MKYILPLLLICQLGFSQSKQSTIPFYDQEISLDGKLEEPIWDQLSEHSDFYNFFPLDGGEVENQTIVKLFHNGKDLYIAAVYHDSNSETFYSSMKRDDHYNSTILSDAFGVIIDPFNEEQSGYSFAINTGGALVDGLVETAGNSYDLNTSWSTNWEGKSTLDGNHKIFEIRIPLKALAYTEHNANWGFNFFVKDTRLNQWMIYNRMSNNNYQFDLRFTADFTMENLPKSNGSKFVVVPSLSINHQRDIVEDVMDTKLTPSADLQYNITSSLVLDATINPDFSQIEIDQQVTNLTRFAVNFPERRNFFLENSDLFSKLGSEGVNPFYSRRIGQHTDIKFGIKLSGNIAKNTRIGLLNTQTAGNDGFHADNSTVAVVQQKLNKIFTTTAFVINKQETTDFHFDKTYNRIVGANLNFKSKNNRWTGLTNVATALGDEISGSSNFYSSKVWYSSRKAMGEFGVEKVEENYITTLGFNPRLYNFDALNQTSIRKGYYHTSGYFGLTRFPKMEALDKHRYVGFTTDSYHSINGELSELNTRFNNGFFLKNSASGYFNIYYDYIDLQYGFDPLRNGNILALEQYNNVALRIGYSTPANKTTSYSSSLQYGSYYGGKRFRGSANIKYKLLPIANFKLEYELNSLDIGKLGKTDFHLISFISEVFFSTELNWTTYFQYNTQYDNFNINSRIQWEYKPLSYIYLVATNNFDKEIQQTNWGVAFKANYRLDF